MSERINPAPCPLQHTGELTLPTSDTRCSNWREGLAPHLGEIVELALVGGVSVSGLDLGT